MGEYKIVISGPMGSGKTTALTAVSEIPPVTTDVDNNQRDQADKATTTVAMDYGEVRLGDEGVLRLYGTPGQERFDFMRAILARGALGIVLLVDAQRPAPEDDLQAFVSGFGLGRQPMPFVVGVTKSDLCKDIDALVTRLHDRLERIGAPAPCICCDVRERPQVLMLLDILIALVEARLPPRV